MVQWSIPSASALELVPILSESRSDLGVALALQTDTGTAPAGAATPCRHHRWGNPELRREREMATSKMKISLEACGQGYTNHSVRAAYNPEHQIIQIIGYSNIWCQDIQQIVFQLWQLQVPISRQIRQRRFWDEVGWNGECNQLKKEETEETEETKLVRWPKVLETSESWSLRRRKLQASVPDLSTFTAV